MIEGGVAGYEGEEGVVLAAADVLAGSELGFSLPDEDVAGDDGSTCVADESARTCRSVFASLAAKPLDVNQWVIEPSPSFEEPSPL